MHEEMEIGTGKKSRDKKGRSDFLEGWLCLGALGQADGGEHILRCMRHGWGVGGIQEHSLMHSLLFIDMYITMNTSNIRTRAAGRRTELTQHKHIIQAHRYHTVSQNTVIAGVSKWNKSRSTRNGRARMYSTIYNS